MGTPHNTMKDENASRKFIDLIYESSTKYANWDPPVQIQVGDYGIINNDTGAFERSGNIYDEHFKAFLPNAATRYPVRHGEIEGNMIITSRAISYKELGIDAIASFAGVIEGSLSGQWEFGRTDRGALLMISRPRSHWLEWSGPPDVLYGISVLKGKSIVISTVNCPAYALYLSNTQRDVVSLAMVTNGVPVAAGVTAGGSLNGTWRKEKGSGFYRDAVNPGFTFTPLFTLREAVKRPWWRFRDDPSPERKGLDQLADSRPPWGALDSEGEYDEIEML